MADAILLNRTPQQENSFNFEVNAVVLAYIQQKWPNNRLLRMRTLHVLVTVYRNKDFVFYLYELQFKILSALLISGR